MYRITGSYLREFLSGLEKQGYNVDDIYPDIELVYNSVGSSDRELRLKRLKSMFERLWCVTGDEFGGALSQPCNPGVYALMTKVVSDSKTIGHLLEGGLNFYNTVRNDLVTELEICGDNCKITSYLNGPEKDNTRISIVFWLLFWKKLCGWCSGKDIELRHAAISPYSESSLIECSELFQCSSVIESDICSIVFNKKYLERDLIRLPSSAGKVSMRQAFEIILDHGKMQSYKRRVTNYVRQSIRIKHSNVDIESVADHLGMNKLCLYRQLKIEGVTFQHLKDEVRKELALERLDGKTSSVAEISYSLGFSEPGAFSRAFKQWVGITPTEYRMRMS